MAKSEGLSDLSASTRGRNGHLYMSDWPGGAGAIRISHPKPASPDYLNQLLLLQLSANQVKYEHPLQVAFNAFLA
jgi:hypothetical protein